jgi:hypothetical protein
MRAERIRRSTRMNASQEHAGPTRNDEVTERLARDLYEQVRQLNHATGGPPGLTRPSTAYTVLGNLSAAAHGIDQTLAQLDRFLRHERNAGHLGHDQGDLNAAIRDCGQALARARIDARALSKATGDAQNAISAVHGPLSPALGEASPSQQTISEPKGQQQGPRTAGDLAAEGFPAPITDTLQAGSGSEPASGRHSPPLPVRTTGKRV